MPDNTKLIFTTVAYPVEWSEANTLLLIESIRNFGGDLSQSPIWCFVPDFGPQPSEPFRKRITELNAELISFEIEREIARFFFAADIRAAALAESLADGKTDILAWVSSNTIILQEPADLLLAADKNLGYRPVHHANVGSLYDKPIDPFWSLVYRYCNVPEERVFPMKTHVDQNILRPYFNAGILVIRPEDGLFKTWQDKFFEIYQAPELTELYESDERYLIFIHQALLSGVILSTFAPSEIQELPRSYNYPLHLFEEDVTAHRPSSLDELITVRHEGLQKITDWINKIPGGEQFKQWLAERGR
ncbi:MAG: hypothetical protein OEV79_00055 [candidate division WOR-3 bacterium]|nr:hypothetical protein [candidate division WOR-3 bacterium]